jgi:hypothetical protein
MPLCHIKCQRSDGMSFTGHTEQTKRRIAEAHRGRSHGHGAAISAGKKLAKANGGVMPHGTPGRYKSNPPCRCDECREAWRLYKGARRKVKRS